MPAPMAERVKGAWGGMWPNEEGVGVAEFEAMPQVPGGPQ